MAKFRKIHTSFWDDRDVEKMTPEEKYFFLFLLTNPLATECGIYQISVKKISFFTGYNCETVEKLITRFTDSGKILYSLITNEIAIIKRPNYIDRLGKPVIDCLHSELKRVKEISFIQHVSDGILNNEIKAIYDTYTIRTTIRVQDKEEDKEEDKDKEAPTTTDLTLKKEKIIEIFSQIRSEIPAAVIKIEAEKLLTKKPELDPVKHINYINACANNLKYKSNKKSMVL